MADCKAAARPTQALGRQSHSSQGHRERVLGRRDDVPRLPEAVVSLTETKRARAKAKRDALVVEHLAMVPAIARGLLNHLPPCFELDDLISVGHIALVECAARFRPSEHGGTPFSAYARQRIRGAMLDSVKGPRWKNSTMAPLDTLTTDTLHVAPVIETEIDEGRLRRQLDEAIEELPRRERLLVRGYRDERPLETTARRLGLSPSRAIHIKADGVDLLRKNFALPTAG